VEIERDPIFLLQGEALEETLLEAIEMAMYDSDPLLRDEGRVILIKRAQKQQIQTLIQLLDAEHKQTRQRAVRLLSEMQSKQVLPLLDQWYTSKPSARALQNASRIWATLTDGFSTMLLKLIAHEDVSVRRTAICHAFPSEGLGQALKDIDAEIVEKTALQYLRRGISPSQEDLEIALKQHPQIDLLKNLQGQLSQNHPQIIALSKNHDRIAMSYLGDVSTIVYMLKQALESDNHQTKHTSDLSDWAWAFAKNLQEIQKQMPGDVEVILDILLHHENRDVRSSLAKFLPIDHLGLDLLLEDRDPAVVWLAKQNRLGAFDRQILNDRLKPHARLTLPSAKPPYGLRYDDEIPPLQRVKAALALCHTRFDVNVGVAMRSAEAAGFDALYLMGQPARGLSSARGAELAVPVINVPDPSGLVYEARAKGYQIVAVQQCPKSVPYHQADYPPNPIFVLGAEDDGIPAKLLAAADLVVEIPLYGAIDSLNVSTAATCVMMHWRMLVADSALKS
jgi:tRNA(Leu) C34 or U34 (ribose-2'-O)-methylase TrmL